MPAAVSSSPRPADAAAPYGLSPAQQGLLFHALLSPGEALYFEQRWCTVDGPLDAAAFRQAWQQVLQAHEALRSGFVWQDGAAPFQQPAAVADLPWTEQDWRAMDEAAQARAFEAFVAEDRARGFVPDAPPLMRCALLRTGPQRHRFVWSYHHLLMDGWSNALVIAEVLARYEALARGEAPALPPARPYREHIAWLQRQDRAGAERHWREALQAVQAPTPLPWLRAAAAGEPPGAPSEQVLALSTADTAALDAWARDARLTLNTLVQGAWALLLARASGQPQVLFGATVSGRPPTLADAERRVGLFIQTVPVPVAVPPQAEPLAWLQALQASLRAHEQHAHLGLADLQRLTPVPGGTALFDSVLVFENYPLSSAAALAAGSGPLALGDVGGFERTNYPLALMVLPGERLTLVLRHDEGRLPPDGAARLLGQVAALMKALATAQRSGPPAGERCSADAGRDDAQTPWSPAPVRCLADLSAIDAQARALLEAAAQGVRRPLPAQLVHESIGAQAAVAGDATALVFEPGAGRDDAAPWTYRDLDAAANRLARHLRAQGIGRGARVGVCLPRSPQLVAALLAVWKAGAAYVPLDPLHPAARRALIVGRAGLSRLIVAGAAGAAASEGLAAHGVPTTDLDAEAGAIAARPAEAFATPLGPQDPAYLMFTSGSTGTPKGVAVSHGALANLIASMADEPGLQPGESLLALTTVAFDIAGLELWLPLVRGGRLVLASADVARDAAQLARQIEHHRIDVMQATPATWQLLRDAGWPGAPRLRAWVGGEALDAGLAAWLLGRCGAVWNVYGPTETTIWSTALRLRPGLLVPGEPVPIGGPVANTRLLVIDSHGQPAPVGVPGELLIGGDGVAEGYVGQPALTAQAFVPDPRATAAGQGGGRPGGRFYRTGDLVRWRADGLLDFLGRADHQVKLRGHRIELGEIEAVLAEQPGVAQAVVLLRADLPGGPELVAYLRPSATGAGTDADGAAPLDVGALRAALQARLPAYMLPAHWQVLAAFPLTPNGKTDRRALPLPQAGTGEPAAQGDAAPPGLAADPLLALVAGVWAEVLGRPVARADDDFFALGGHSLSATRAVARLQTLQRDGSLPGAPVPLRLLFEQPRLADFAQALRRNAGGAPALPPVQRGADDAPALPLPAQHRQWLVAQFAPSSRAYTIGLQVELDGALDEASLHGALQALIDRHEALRTGFAPGEDGLPVVTVRPPVRLPLARVDAAAERLDLQAAIDAELARPFDLARPPLLRATLLRVAGTRHVLLLALHHIVADDASIGVLARELAEGYALRVDAAASDAAGHRSVPAPAPALRLRDVAAWQHALDLQPQRRHWQAVLEGAPAPRPLAIDRQAAGSGRAAPGAAGVHVQHFDAAQAAALEALARRHGATLYMVMLAGLAALLQRYGAGDDVVIGSPVAGRPRTGQPEVDGLVGMFVNTLPLRLPLAGRPGTAALLARVRAATLAAWEHQDLPFEQVLEGLPAARRQTGLFDVVFSLQNAHGALPAAELPGGLRWSPGAVAPLEAKFPLGVAVRPVGQGHAGPPPVPSTPSGDGLGAARPTGHAGPGGLVATWEFDATRFEADAIARMAGHWAALLAQMAGDAEQPVAALPMLTPDEAAQIAAWSRPHGPQAAPTGTLDGAFLRQAAATPEAVALVDGERQWRYRELAEAAGTLAAQLRAEGVGAARDADGFIGLWGERSAEAIVGLLAILMAGGAYVPLDPQAPAARLASVVEQTGLRWVLVPRSGCIGALQQERAAAGAAALGEWIVALHAPREAAGPGVAPREAEGPGVALGEAAGQRAGTAAEGPRRDGDEAAASERLAYVMLTSGTTGGPKAVGTPHRGVLRLVQQPDYVSLGPAEVVLQAAPLAFDAATFEIWSALLHGGTLVVAPMASLETLAALIERHGVSTMWLTAGLLQLLVDERLDALQGVRQLLAGGDVLSAPHVARLLQAWPRLRLVNGYGPTETTTFACCHTVTAQDAAGGRIPIGRPIDHTRVQVLDEAGLPVPVGLPGELHIGGAGVARGYLGRPAATATAFVPDAACSLEDGEGEAAQVLYRTGDLVRWRADGVLEFLGRNDRQLKLRGFRIEPAEIEQRLAAHPAVKEAVVALRTDGQGRPRLAAWLVAWPGATKTGRAERTSPSALRQWVGQVLPEPSIPAHFVWIDALPLTANGKVDRAALVLPAPRGRTGAGAGAEPAGAAGAAAQDTAPAMPAAPAEAIEAEAPSEVPGLTASRLQALWRKLMPDVQPGLHDNFFDLGGDSIIAMQLASRATAIGLPLTPAQVFEHGTIASLAAALDAAGPAGGGAARADAPREEGPVPLTPIQHWFFAQRLAQPSHFNQAVCVTLPAATDRAALQAALDAVAARHDALRLRFTQDAAGWHAALAPGDAQAPIAWSDLAALPAQAQDTVVAVTAQAVQAGLDITQGPLLRAAAFDLGPRGLRLLVAVHHLAVDGVSWRVLMAEWQQAWQQAALGGPIVLGPRPPGPRAWARRLAESEAAPSALAYWRGQAAPAAAAALPLDGSAAPGEPALQADARTLHCSLPADVTQRLLRHPSPVPLMLTALLRALAPWTGAREALLALESHGRDAAPEFAGSVGWFTALHPLRLSLGDAGGPGDAEAGLRAELSHVEAQCAAVPDQGRSWGVLRWLGGHEALAAQPPIAFNYLGQLPGGAGEGAAWRREPVPGAAHAPANARAHLIDANCWVEDGCWTMAWTYGARHVTEAAMSAVVQRLAAELPRLLDAAAPAAAPPGAPGRSEGTALLPAGVARPPSAPPADDALAAALSQVSFE